MRSQTSRHLVVSENQRSALARWRQLRSFARNPSTTPKPSPTWKLTPTCGSAWKEHVLGIFGGCLRLLHFFAFLQSKNGTCHVVSLESINDIWLVRFEIHQIKCFGWLATRLQPHTNQKNHTRTTCCFSLRVQRVLAGSGCDTGTRQVQVVFRVFTCFVRCFFQDEAVLSVIMAKAARIPAFDVVCWV